MLRRDRQIRMQIHQLVDAFLFALAFWVAHSLRTNPDFADLVHLERFNDPFSSYVVLYVALIILSPLILEAQGFYDRPQICSRRATLWPLFKGCLIATVGLIVALYFFRLQPARWIVIWFGFISFALVYLKEEALQAVARTRIAEGYKRRFILLGLAGDTDHLRREIRNRPEAAIEIVQELDLNELSLAQLVPMLHDLAINGVILSARHTNFEQAENVIKACELEGIETWVVADFFRTQISHASFDDFYGRPVMVFRSAPETSWRRLVKQVMDFFGALVMLVVLALPLAVVALVIKITSPGPVLFRQTRSGLNGSPFTIYKFRTMVTNAEQLKHELEAMNEMRGPVFKVSNDPRITPMGRWLRKYSVDEFPQFLNVLRGEMSLVGPRPLPVDEVKRFNDLAHRRRLSVRPGLTCLWQVSGRNEINDFQDWVRLDLEYIDNWSLWLDIKILFRTIPVVLRGTGAK